MALKFLARQAVVVGAGMAGLAAARVLADCFEHVTVLERDTLPTETSHRLKGDHPVNRRKFHEIWIEQCDAAQEIKLRYGLKAAFDYVVAEKLLNFADVAASDPEFARQLPRFIARVRGLFTPQEIRTQLDRIGHELREYDADTEEADNFDKADELHEKDELIIESRAAAAERARQFATIRELLTVAELGTS